MSTLEKIFMYVNEKHNTKLSTIQDDLGYTAMDIALALAVLEKEGLIDVLSDATGIFINGKATRLPKQLTSIAVKTTDFDSFKDRHFSSKEKILH